MGGTQDRIRDRAIVVGQARGDVDRDDGPRLDGGEPVEELHGFRECARERALAPVPTMLSIRACARNTSDHAGVFSMERSDCPPRSMMRTTAAATSARDVEHVAVQISLRNRLINALFSSSRAWARTEQLYQS